MDLGVAQPFQWFLQMLVLMIPAGPVAKLANLDINLQQQQQALLKCT